MTQVSCPHKSGRGCYTLVKLAKMLIFFPMAEETTFPIPSSLSHGVSPEFCFIGSPKASELFPVSCSGQFVPAVCDMVFS